MAVFINIVRIFTLYYWIIDTSDEDRVKILDAEAKLIAALEQKVFSGPV